MSRAVSFVVRGTPIPQGSKGVTVTKNGKPTLFDVNAAPLRRWRKAIAFEAEMNRGTWLRQSPLHVHLIFQLPAPKSKFDGDWVPVKPDIDKLVRAVLDGLTDGGAFIDDAQVVSIQAEKRYGEPGVIIRVTDAHNRNKQQENPLCLT